MKMLIVNFIKRLIVNTLTTTSLSIFLMCIVAFIKEFTLMKITVPFEILLVNFLAHIGFFITDMINMKYRILNYVTMLIYLIGIIIGFGFLFDWFAVNDFWIVCVVGVIVFIIAISIDTIKINQDAKKINSTLQKLRNIKDEKAQ